MAVPQALISYIAPGAPATRRPADGTEPFLRLELGFTPRWYQQNVKVDFGERWHTDPAYRRETVPAMRQILAHRFPGTDAGRTSSPTDLLTGAFGACTVAALYGVPIVYAPDNWPCTGHQYLTDNQVESLTPPDLDDNPFFAELMRQLDWIEQEEGSLAGYINWQGVLNNAARLRGEALLVDMMEAPDRARHLLDCVCTTMIDSARRVHARQRLSGFDVRFFTVSNCMVNMVSPETYAGLLLPLDRRIAESFGCIGIHNCAWTIDPYARHYATVPQVGYIDMGLHSAFPPVKALFPHARRAVMYTPMDLASKSPDQLQRDFARIAGELGPCDLVCADVDAHVPDTRVLDVARLVRKVSSLHERGTGDWRFY